MEIARIFTDSAGGSHFEEVPIQMDSKGQWGFFSQPYENISHWYFQNTLPHHEWDFSAVKDQVYVVVLEGKLQVEVSDGETIDFLPGQVICLDDHSGQGHKVRTFENTARVMVIHMT